MMYVEGYLKTIINGKVKNVYVGEVGYFFVERDAKQYLNEYEDTDLLGRDRKGRDYEIVKAPISELKNIPENEFEIFEVEDVNRLFLDRMVNIDYNAAYIDIECCDRNGFPKPDRDEVVCIGAICDGEFEWFYGDEREMMYDFMEWLMKNKVNLIAGWNIGFDYNYLIDRMKVLRCWEPFEYLGLCETVDLLSEYKNAVKGLSSYSLGEVSEYEGFERKVMEKKVCNMTVCELAKYNEYDVRLCEMIDSRYGFVDTKIELAKFVNIPISRLNASMLGDRLVYDRLRELGYVMVNKQRFEKERYPGAIVLTPKPGIYEGVIYVDVNSLYPNVIRHKKIDIDGWNGEVYPVIMERLLDMRAEMKRLYKETGEKKYNLKQLVYKILANSCYGLFGYRGFRYYNPEKARMVTSGGRDVLMKMKEFIESKGYDVIYGDTDSLFIHIGKCDKDVLERKADELVKEINVVISPFSVKLEDMFVRMMIFKKGGNTNEGAKKRYIALRFDGSYYYRGLELRRSDYFMLVKEVLKDVIDMVMKEGKKKKDVKRYLVDVKSRMYRGEFDEKLIVSRKMSKNVDEYKREDELVRAYKKAMKKYGAVISHTLMYVYVRGGDVEPIMSESEVKGLKLDYGRYWSKLERVIDRILAVLEETKTIEEWF